MDSIEFGAIGENIAETYLSRMGWKIIDRNVRAGRGELDIIAHDGEELVVVEVRTRSIGKIMPAETSVGPRKLRRLVKTARVFLDKKGYTGNWRIDVIAVTKNRAGEFTVELFRDVTTGSEIAEF
jgi:putative endonuclease